MRRFFTVISASFAISMLATPVLADAPDDSQPQANSQAEPELEAYKKRSGSAKRGGSGGASPHAAAPGKRGSAASAPGSRSGQGAQAPSRGATGPSQGSAAKPGAGKAHPGGAKAGAAKAHPGRSKAGAAKSGASARRTAHNVHRHKVSSRHGAHRHHSTRARAAARGRSVAAHRRAAHSTRAHRAWSYRRAGHGWWNWRHRPYHPRGWRPNWAYGVFLYPRASVTVRGGSGGGSGGAVAAPPRQVDRTRSFAIGMRGGSYVSSYAHYPGFQREAAYGDFGLGLAGRFRATESLGFEVAWQRYDETWSADSERITQPITASVQLFAFPWTKVSPYATAGVTWTNRCYNDTYYDGWENITVDQQDWLWGPHGGLGIEFGVGDNASINLEARATGYLNKEADDPSAPAAYQGTAGFNFYF